MTTYAHMDDQELATEIAQRQQMQRINQGTLQRMQYDLQSRLEARGATELPHPDLVVKLEYPSPVYDVGKLAALREHLPEALLLETRAWTPEHVETVMVAEKYDARVFRTWGAKYGVEVKAAIDAARMPGGPARLRVTEKKV